MVVIGVRMMPATAPSAPLRKNDRAIIRLTGMPASIADRRLAATARMAFPVRVRAKNRLSTATTATVMPKIQILWGMTAAPRNKMGSSPEKGAKVMAFFPQTAMVRPLIKMDAPTVIMTRLRISWDLDGRKAVFSSSMPMIATAKTLRTKAAAMGSFRYP